MMMRRLLAALVIALLFSGAFTYLVARRLARSHPAAAPFRYVTVTRDMDAGEVLKAADLTEVAWPATAPVAGALTQVADVAGRAVLSPLTSGQPLLARQLSAVGGIGLAARVPNGLRAISLRSDQVVGVAGFLLPGTHIDVLVTYREAGTPDAVTAMVMGDAEVLATGQKMQPDPEGKPTTTDVVTLLVSPQDAEKLVLASSQGTLHFVLRNGADRQDQTPSPLRLAALGLPGVATARPKPVQSATAHPRAASFPAPKPYSVTVVRGDKQTVETF